MSQRHACRLLGLERSTHRYRAQKTERDGALRGRLQELAAKRMRFGDLRLTAMLVREGMAVNHKRVYRLYREEGLVMTDSAAAADPLERRGSQPRSDPAQPPLVDGFRE